MSKFNMDFEYNDSKTEEITEATNVDAMDCAIIAAECSAILVNYQKIQLEAYTNADGNEELYNSEIAIVSEGFFADMWKKIKDFLMKIVDGLINILKTIWGKMKTLWLKAKAAVIKFIKDHKSTKENYTGVVMLMESNGIPGKDVFMSYSEIAEGIDNLLAGVNKMTANINNCFKSDFIYTEKLDKSPYDDKIRVDANGNCKYPRGNAMVEYLYSQCDSLQVVDDNFIIRAGKWFEDSKNEEYVKKFSDLGETLDAAKKTIREATKELNGSLDVKEYQDNLKFNTNFMLSTMNMFGSLAFALVRIGDDTTKAIMKYSNV